MSVLRSRRCLTLLGGLGTVGLFAAMPATALSAAVKPAATTAHRAGCDHRDAQLARPTGSVGAHRNVQFYARFRELPKACRDETWEATVQLREDGGWTSLLTWTLSRHELHRGIHTIVQVPQGDDSARLRVRVTEDGRYVDKSPSIVVDMTRFADLPPAE